MKNVAVQKWNPQTEYVNKSLQLQEPNEKEEVPSNVVKKEKTDTPESTYKELTADDFPHAFVCTVVGSRRTGKTCVVESLLNSMTKRFDTVFLFSPTLAGFEGIPNNYKFQTLDILPQLLQKQQEVTTHNIKANKKDHIESRVALVLDDMLATNELKNKLLTKIALNGRHLNSKDPVETNELCTFILSQSATGIPKNIRRNSDIILSSRIPSKTDRKTIIEENLVLDSSRGGMSAAYNLYDSISLERDYA